jgi:hypothetical protein
MDVQNAAMELDAITAIKDYFLLLTENASTTAPKDIFQLMEDALNV